MAKKRDSKSLGKTTPHLKESPSAITKPKEFDLDDIIDMAVSRAGLSFWSWNLRSDELRLNKHLNDDRPEDPPYGLPAFSTWGAIIHSNDRDRVLRQLEEYKKSDCCSFNSRFRLAISNPTQVYARDLQVFLANGKPV